jgi:hypothetical protein
MDHIWMKQKANQHHSKCYFDEGDQGVPLSASLQVGLPQRKLPLEDLYKVYVPYKVLKCIGPVV